MFICSDTYFERLTLKEPLSVDAGAFAQRAWCYPELETSSRASTIRGVSHLHYMIELLVWRSDADVHRLDQLRHERRSGGWGIGSVAA